MVSLISPALPTAGARTEQSWGRVWMQPELSFCTQQPEPRSRSRSRWMSRSTCWSLRMHGENLAPRWIRSIWQGDASKGDLSVHLQLPPGRDQQGQGVSRGSRQRSLSSQWRESSTIPL